ncbi:MAG: Hsp33 family molecular chaperone HslO [Acidobacteriota bacterium]
MSDDPSSPESNRPSNPSPRLLPLSEVADPSAAGELRLGLAGDGDLRWAAVDVTAILEDARHRFDLSPLAAVAMGQAMAAAALLLRFSTKYPGRLRFEVQGDGPIGKVYADADSNGMVRGMVDQLQIADPGGRLALSPAIGKGLLRVTQESKEKGPWSSQVELVSGEIGQDLTHFLHQSYQVRSAALLGVLPAPEGIAAAGGFLIEALPGADEGRVDRLEQGISGLGGRVSPALRSGGLDALCSSVLEGFDTEELERHKLRYTCSCRREALENRMRGLPPADLSEVADEQGQAELMCAFCNGSFIVSVADLLADGVN